jgi:hypothetical protein
MYLCTCEIAAENGALGAVFGVLSTAPQHVSLTPLQALTVSSLHVPVTSSSKRTSHDFDFLNTGATNLRTSSPLSKLAQHSSLRNYYKGPVTGKLSSAEHFSSPEPHIELYWQFRIHKMLKFLLLLVPFVIDSTPMRVRVGGVRLASPQ